MLFKLNSKDASVHMNFQNSQMQKYYKVNMYSLSGEVDLVNHYYPSIHAHYFNIAGNSSDDSLIAIIEYLVKNCRTEDMKCGLSAVAKLTSRPYYTGSFSSANDVLSYIKETISSLSVSTSTINNLEFATAVRKDIIFNVFKTLLSAIRVNNCEFNFTCVTIDHKIIVMLSKDFYEVRTIERLLKAQYDGMIIDIAGFNSKSASNSNFEEQLLLARPLHDEDLIRLNQVTMMMTGNYEPLPDTIFDDFSLKQYMLNKYGAVMVN